MQVQDSRNKRIFVRKEMKLLIRERMMITFCCNKCNKRLFDYKSGTLNIEMKCDRCKRVLRLKNVDENYVDTRIVRGKMFV